MSGPIYPLLKEPVVVHRGSESNIERAWRDSRRGRHHRILPLAIEGMELLPKELRLDVPCEK